MLLDDYAKIVFGRDATPSSLKTEELVLVDITEAARLFYEDSKQEFWDWQKDFPTAVCPWPLAWLEWRLPCASHSHQGIAVFTYRARLGACVICARWDPNKPAPSVHPMIQRTKEAYFRRNGEPVKLEGEIECPPFVEPVHWMQMMILYVETPGRELLKIGHVYDYLNEKGVPILAENGSPVRRVLQNDELLETEVGLLPAIFAISLMHCKNVTVLDRPIPQKVQRARERRGKEPKIVYKTLVVEPMKRILRTEGQSQEVGLQRALHICRGHFKDYREKGLFGMDTHKGVYWWESHLRGTPEAGEIVKTYKVVPGEQVLRMASIADREKSR